MATTNEVTLASLVKSVSRTTTVEFRGVRFEVRYLSRAALSQIAVESQVVTFDPKRKGRTTQLDPERYSIALGQAIVKGWSGLTWGNLPQLVPVDYPEDFPAEKLTEEVPFTNENLQLLLQNVTDLDNFLLEVAMAPESFRAATPTPEAVEKNSETTSAGS